MSRFKDRPPSPAIVVALVALFVAMSGSAVAATTLLVHTGNIANGAVTGSKIADGAVSMNKLARTVRVALDRSGEPRGTVSGARGRPDRRDPRGHRVRTDRTDRTARTGGTAGTV